MPSSTDTSFAESAPTDKQITEYDRAHLVAYLRLLDAAAAKAAWEDAARIVLNLDPAREPDRAWRIYESHLARARWLSEHGYRQMIQTPPDDRSMAS